MSKMLRGAANVLAFAACTLAALTSNSLALAGTTSTASPVITAVYTTYSATGVPTNLNITGTGLCSTATCTTKPVVKLAGITQTVTGGTSTGVGVKLGVIADGDYVLNLTVGSYSASYNLTIKSGLSGTGGTATVSVGTTTTGAAGTGALVTNSGTDTAAVLNFTIPRGEQGPAGAPGAPGQTGPQGVPGPTGPAGQTGGTGPMGLQGPAGADGAPGPVGPAGAKGDKGDPGDAGAAGADGKGLAFKGAWAAGTAYAPLDVVTQEGSSFIAVASSTGVSPSSDVAGDGGNWAMLAAKGAEGPQGPAGVDGAPGAVGPQGPAGVDGAPGAAGPQGPAGVDGAPGAVGPQGPAGADGAPGRDGADGLPGLPGMPGAPGPQGPTGPQGPAGAEGPTGPQGPAGATGATGAAGTGVIARGAWSASATYQPNDLVSYGGATYIATATTTSSGGAGYSHIVNIDWIANATTDSTGSTFPGGASTIRLNLPAGTYTATPIGPAQGGAFTAGQLCICNISQGVPSWWWGFHYRTSANPTPTFIMDVANRRWTAAEALSGAAATTITLASDGWIEFLLVDNPIGDNTNGVSLLLTAPGSTTTTPDQDSAHWAVFAAAGAAGPAGPAGSDGLPGPAGATGATGPQGPAGPVGPTGAAGVGLPGPQGPTGPAGPEGPQGPAGPIGSLPAGTSAGTMLYWTGTAWTEVTPPSSSGVTLLFCDGKPMWAAACPSAPAVNAQIVLTEAAVIGSTGWYSEPIPVYSPTNIFDQQSGAITTETCGSGDYWIAQNTGPADAYITIDLGDSYIISSLELFNTSNGGACIDSGDRGTGSFVIRGGNAIYPDGVRGYNLASDAFTLSSGTLNAEIAGTAVDAQSFSSTSQTAVRYLQFRPTSVAAQRITNPLWYGLNELRVFGHKATSTPTTPTNPTTLSAADVANPATQVFNSANGHIYEKVTTAATFADAVTAAAAKSIHGVTGHLVTITSSAEQLFLSNSFPGLVHWIAASDSTTEGDWRWIAGPESGQQFWQGGTNGTAVNGAYNNWRTSASVQAIPEPNDQGGEDCARVETNLEVIWNDGGCSTSNAYVIEYSP